MKITYKKIYIYTLVFILLVSSIVALEIYNNNAIKNALVKSNILEVEDVVEINSIQLSNIFSNWKDCQENCQIPMEMGSFTRVKIINADGFEVFKKDRKDNATNSQKQDNIYSNVPGFWKIKTSINEHTIIGFLRTDIIDPLSYTSLYVDDIKVFGAGLMVGENYPGTNIKFKRLVPENKWLLILELAMILFFLYYIFYIIRRENDIQALTINIKDQTMSLTEANKELETERDVFSDGPVMILKWDYGLNWSVTYASPNTVKIIGYGYADFMGDSTYDSIIHYEDIQRIKDDIEKLVKSGDEVIHHREFRLRIRNSDDYLWVDANSKRILSGERGMGFITYMVDVNDKMDAFMGLRNQRLAMDQATILSTTDLKGNINYVNDIFCELSGYEREFILEDEKKSLISMNTDQEEMIMEEMSSVLLRGGIWYGDIKYQNKKGQFYWVSTTIIPTLTEAGTVFEYQYIGFEVTEARNLQEELEAQKDIAEKANKAKSQFLANMSHELRTPMNGLMGMAELLKNTNLTSQQIGFVDGIISSSNHQLTLLNDILDLTKLQESKVDLEYKNISVKDIAIEVIQMFASSTAKGSDLEIYLMIERSVGEEYVLDEVRLKQVIVNLMSNAIKFTKWGAVELEIVKSKNHKGLRIEVKDTGIGISEEGQKKLFKKFSQVDETINRKFGGTGLGLSICKYIVSAMKGDIGVNSVEAVGSTFYVDLPISMVKGPKKVGSLPREVFIVGGNKKRQDILSTLLDSYSIKNTSIKDFNTELIDDLAEDVMYLVNTGDGIKKEEKLIKKLGISDMCIFLIPVGMNIKPTFKVDYIVTPIISDFVITALSNKKNGIKNNKEIINEHKKAPIRKIISSDSEFLVVDDNKSNRGILQLFIEAFGGSVDLANDGKQAIEKIQSNDYDLVFMDCHMPVMNGFDAISNTRDLGINVPIVMLTADITDEAKRTAKKAGSNGFMLKPIDTEELRRVILKYVQRLEEEEGEDDEDLLSENIIVIDEGSEDWNGLNLSTLDMMYDLDPETVKEVVSSIADQQKELAKSWKSFKKDDEIVSLERMVHKFKGGALSFAKIELITDFGELNQYMQEHESEFDSKKIIAELSDLMIRSDDYISDLIGYMEEKNKEQQQ